VVMRSQYLTYCYAAATTTTDIAVAQDVAKAAVYFIT
jgi:hypothetical protein